MCLCLEESGVKSSKESENSQEVCTVISSRSLAGAGTPWHFLGAVQRGTHGHQRSDQKIRIFRDLSICIRDLLVLVTVLFSHLTRRYHKFLQNFPG